MSETTGSESAAPVESNPTSETETDAAPVESNPTPDSDVNLDDLPEGEPEQTDNTERPEDGPQDVSQDPNDVPDSEE